MWKANRAPTITGGLSVRHLSTDTDRSAEDADSQHCWPDRSQDTPTPVPVLPSSPKIIPPSKSTNRRPASPCTCITINNNPRRLPLQFKVTAARTYYYHDPWSDLPVAESHNPRLQRNPGGRLSLFSP